MFIIPSAAFVLEEFQHEFGPLPPSFLPVGNKRLFEHQINSIREAYGPLEAIILSLPNYFAVPEKDLIWLKNQSVDIITLPPTLSLRDSLKSFIEHVINKKKEIRILYGDTLIHSSELKPKYSNFIGLAKTTEDYNWETEQDFIWCGFFGIQKPEEFLLSLKKESNFINAVKDYGANHCFDKIEIKSWCDFGHINTYYKSRAKITTERSFNELKIKNGVVRKSGIHSKKIEAEALWYKNLPAHLKIYTPQLISCSTESPNPYYELEYLCLSPLNEIYIHGRKPLSFWKKICSLLKDWFKSCQYQTISDENLLKIKESAIHLISTKSRSRLKIYERKSTIDLNQPIYLNDKLFPPVFNILEDCIDKSLKLPLYYGILHGDLCFSNMLYDSRADRVKLIDPRGVDFYNNASVYGDLKYDLAKIIHSAIGLYDLIIAGAYEFKKTKKNKFDALCFYFEDRDFKTIQNYILNHEFLEDFKTSDILPLTSLLFLSMLPLHCDNPSRQNAFLSNALRMYGLHKEFI